MNPFPLAVLLSSFVWVQVQNPPKVWRVSERPILSIGSSDAEGPELFGSIAGAVRLSSGTVVVADGKSLELRFFSPAGKHLKTSGRRGGGPGEFRNISAVQRCAGDSVFVYDAALFRMSAFSPDGAYTRAIPMQGWMSNGLPPYDFWCHHGGVLAFVHRSTDRPKLEGPLRHNVEISLVNRNDSVISLGTFPASEMYFQAPAAGPRHLGKKTTVAVGSKSVYVGTGDAFEIAKFSFRGERIGTLREARAPISVTAAQVTTYIKEFIASRPRRVNTSRHEQYFRDLEWPTVYPAYARLMVDGSDNLWIEEYPIPGRDIREWSIYANSGARMAVISLPQGFRLLDAGRDYVLGVWRDQDDIDYIRVYQLVK